MTVVRTLGKNTLGGNNKMKVAMRDYDMSTHDVSTVFRSTIGVGILVPFCKILCQKGDIIDLNLINKTLSQPTLGPLDRKSTRLNSSHRSLSRMPSSA